MQQLLFVVYVREKYTNYLSVFSALECKLWGVMWGDCIHWMSEINTLLYEQLAGLI